MQRLLVTLVSLIALTSANAQTSEIADSINQLGLDLFRQQVATAPTGNLLLSPYSIQTALAMAYAGADGETRVEMQRVLHFSEKDIVPAQLETLRNTLAASTDKDIALRTANRLFAQKGYGFRSDFLALLKDRYAAPLQELNFAQQKKSSSTINHWVETQTEGRIADLISPDALSAATRLLLVNALYFKAPWREPFENRATKPAPFHTSASQSVDVPTMCATEHYGYMKQSSFSVITLPYKNSQFQFVIFLPAPGIPLGKIEPQITPEVLGKCAKLPAQPIALFLPRFKIAGPSINLKDTLQSLGMKTAFDDPRGSANFDRMAPRKPDDYLAINAVVHKTWLDLDEAGTEAAAATAVEMIALGMAMPASEPLEIHVDRPFFFAIQHVASGACLFIGRVTDPRAQ